ncbi:MAG: class I SAM-dependent methyltransferase [Chlamydiota bacterium]
MSTTSKIEPKRINNPTESYSRQVPKDRKVAKIAETQLQQTQQKASPSHHSAFFYTNIGENIKSKKNVFKIFSEALGAKQKFPEHIISVMQSYTDYSVDLSDPDVLANYVEPKNHLSAAMEIVDRGYEVGKRGIGRISKYGFVFPIDPEVLAYAMQLAKNEVVVEIAGASGENAILLAFAGAKKVYMNDIESEEMEVFQKLRSALPFNIKQKLEAVEGNCFDILKKKPEITNKVGLILCRNLIHFFNNQEQTDFFQLLKQMLKPGGRVILTANSVYNWIMDKHIFEQNPDATSFAVTQCLFIDFAKSNLPYAVPYRTIAICADDKVSSNYTNLHLYERNFGTKWKVNNNEFNQLDPSIRPTIKKLLSDRQKEIGAIQAGTVRILINTLRIYNTKNLSAVIQKHGFEVESTFVTSTNGHLINNDDKLFDYGGPIGIIITNPLNN